MAEDQFLAAEEVLAVLAVLMMDRLVMLVVVVDLEVPQ
jgi:hypothetical protein